MASLAMDASVAGSAFSWVPDIANAGISLARGDYLGAGLSAAAALPFVGAAANVARLGRGVTRGPVVVGETMARVEQAVSKIPGAKILNDMPDFKAMGMNRDQVTSAMMQHNRKWILEQMRSGRKIIDIGADANRTRPSIFYQMEQNMLKNYQKLHPEFGGAVSP